MDAWKLFWDWLAGLTVDQRIQLAVAIGQLSAALGASFAAMFSFLSVKEMQKQTRLLQTQNREILQEMHTQTDVLRKTMLASTAPSIIITWFEVTASGDFNTLGDVELYTDVFPDNVEAIQRLQHESAEYKVLDLLSSWWHDPSSVSIQKRGALDRG